MATKPIRPAEKSEEEIVRDRLKTVDQDKKTPWAEVKRRILEQLKPH